MAGDDSFKDWLKRRRKALDLTQAELAHKVGCSIYTIQKIEEAGARPSRQLAELLAGGLEIPADERPAFVQRARTLGPRSEAATAPAPVTAVSTNGNPSASGALTGANPYKGLRAFQEADAPDFFGREALGERLRERLGEDTELARFLAVVGPSGAGKSSVVRAGLLPALRQAGLPGGFRPVVADLSPGTHPLEELEAALLRAAARPPGSLIEQLRADERGLARAVKRVLPGDDGSEVLLLIDQFEELFTMVPDERMRASFINSLFSAVADERSRLRVVITLRADFYDRPLLYLPSSELFGRRSEVVGPLAADEIYRAITGPAERYGVALEAGLAAAIMGDVAEQPGMLPLMEYTLTELYERRAGGLMTLAAYKASGGVFGSLARRAEAVYAQLSAAERAEARQLFLRLVTPGEGVEDTRRRVLLAEVLSAAPDEDALRQVLDRYGRYRMLTFDRDPLSGGPTVEVAHEALLRAWDRLGGWLAESRESLLVQRRLFVAAAEWQRSGQERSYLAAGARLAQFADLGAAGDDPGALALTTDERAYLQASVAAEQQQEAAVREQQARELVLQKRSANRLRALLVGLAVFLVVAAGLAAWALNRSQVAQDNFAHADALRVAAEANNLLSAHGPSELIALFSIRSMNMQYSPQADATLSQAAYLDYPVRRFNAGGAISDLTFSPDGKYLLTAGDDHTAKLWDVATGQLVRTLAGHTQPVSTARFTRDGRRIASLGNEGVAHIWDAVTGQILLTVQQPSVGTGMDLSPDDKYLLTAGLDSTARLWDATTGHLVRVFSLSTGGIDFARFSPDGKHVATSSSEGNSVQLWDLTAKQPLHIFQPGHTLVFSPDGKDLLTGGGDQLARLWDVSGGQLLQVFAGHSGGINNVAYSPDGKYILTAGGDNTARLWDAASGQTVQILADHAGGVFGVAFSPDGQWLATGSGDYTALLWHARSGSAPVPGLPQFTGHTDVVWTAYYSHDGKKVVTASNDRTVRVWDAAGGRELQRIAASDKDGILSAVYSADDTLLLTAGWDNAVNLWNATTGQHLQTFAGHSGPVNRALFLPGGTQILTASADGTVRVWDTASGKELRRFTGQGDQLSGLTIAPGGTVLAATEGDMTVRVWDLTTGQELQVLRGHSDAVNDVAFSPDGKTLLTASSDGSARLWEASSGKELRQFLGHTGFVYSAAFSPDGRTMLTGGADQTVRLWDVATGQELRRFTGHRAAIRSAVFSADGKYVLTASEDGTARLWYADYHDTIRYLCSQLTRDLTPDERTRYGIADPGSTCPAH